MDGDGTPDFETIVWKYSAGTDLTTVETYRIVDGALGAMVDLNVVNGLTADVQTTVFDNNVLVAPISMAALGITAGHDAVVLRPDLVAGHRRPGRRRGAVHRSTRTPRRTGSTTAARTRSGTSTPRATRFVVHRSADAGDAKILLLHALNDAHEPRRGGRARHHRHRAEMYVWYAVVGHRRQQGDRRGRAALHARSPAARSRSAKAARCWPRPPCGPTGTVGYAVLHLPKLSAGTHHLTVAYSGNDYVQATSVDRVLTRASTAGTTDG